MYLAGIGIAERYLYLPSFGLAILIPAFLDRVLPARWAAAAVLVIAALYSAGTVQRNPVWKSNLSVWADTVSKLPDNSYANWHMGRAELDIGNAAKAVPYCEKARVLSPSSYDPYFCLGRSYYLLGENDLAAPVLLAALKIAPDSAEAHYNLSLAYAKEGDAASSDVQFDRGVKLDPASAPVYKDLKDLALAEILLRRAKYAAALALYLGLDEKHPGFAQLHYETALAYEKMNTPGNAITEYRKAIGLNPNYALAYMGLGRLLYKTGRITEAAGYLQVAIRLDPGYAPGVEKLRHDNP